MTTLDLSRPVQREIGYTRYRINQRGSWQLHQSEDWARHAACADADPTIFTGSLTAPRIRQQQILQAKEICAGCPVRQQCLDDALELGSDGVWGGTTERERRQMRRAS